MYCITINASFNGQIALSNFRFDINIGVKNPKKKNVATAYKTIPDRTQKRISFFKTIFVSFKILNNIQPPKPI